MAMLSVSSTLKTLTEAHTVRGRPTLKDVERFRNRSNLIYRGLEHFIVKLIVNQAKLKLISNTLLSIYSGTTTSDESYVHYGNTKDYIVESHLCCKDEQAKFARNVSEEEHSKTTPCQPCDSESKATFPLKTSILLSVNILLLLAFCLFIDMNCYFLAGLILITILIFIAYITVAYFVPCLDVYCETTMNSSLSDYRVHLVKA